VATDLEQIVKNLVEFYDFTGKTVVAIGAGGGQLIGYARHARRVIAIDNDETAVARLSAAVRDRALHDRVEIVHEDVLASRRSGDVVLFEFSLHEISDPVAALDHARSLAPETLVIDHAPGSPWSWYAGEEHGVEACWAAVADASPRRACDVDALQVFDHFDELETRLVQQGVSSRSRIASLRAQQPVVIPMPYRLAWIPDAAF
jgi:hypothetical protein